MPVETGQPLYGQWARTIAGPAREYFVVHNNRRYDSKPIAGVAWGLEHSDDGPLQPSDFSGGEKTVQRVLEGLGFLVENARETYHRRRGRAGVRPNRDVAHRVSSQAGHTVVD